MKTALSPTRRFLLTAGATVAGSFAARSTKGATVSLREAAIRKGLVFGSAIEAVPIRTDAAFRRLMVNEVGLVVPTFEMKWGQTEAKRGSYSYDKAEQVVDFAGGEDLAVRGHAAVWYRNVPDWLVDALSDADGMRVMTDHVGQLVGRFRGRVQQWDVVNEAIEPNDGRPDGLRNSVFLQRLGADYIAEAFRAARKAAPEAKLYYNDYDLEYDTDYQDRKRDAVLQLVGRLKQRGLIDGLGLQSHLKVGNRFKPNRYRDFLRQAAALGVDIVATELDVNDTRLPKDPTVRDPAIAAHVNSVLDVLLDERAVKGLVAWGLTSRYSWLNYPPAQRSDRTPSRGLPYDSELNPTPLRAALLAAFDNAPTRARA